MGFLQIDKFNWEAGLGMVASSSQGADVIIAQAPEEIVFCFAWEGWFMRIGILEDRHSSLGGRTRNNHILFTGGQMLSLHKPQKRLCFPLIGSVGL